MQDNVLILLLHTHTGVPGGYDERYAALIPTIDDCIWMLSRIFRDPCSGQKVTGFALSTVVIYIV